MNIRNQYITFDSSEKVRIAIMFQVASYWNTIKTFYEACVEDNEVDIRIFYVGELSVEQVQVQGTESFLNENGIPYENYSEDSLLQFAPHVALYQPPYDVSYRNPDALSLHLKNKGVRIVYIPYGIEIVDTEDARWNHFHTFVVKNAWRVYTFSEEIREDYIRYCPNRHNVRATGVPRFDLSFKKDLDKAEKSKMILEKAGGRKIILWKLHFPKKIYDGDITVQVTPFIEEYIRFAKMISKYKELYFYVMPHPMFYTHTIDRGLAKQAEELFRIISVCNNAQIYREPDYMAVLRCADAIIIDRSALTIEAAFCNIPVLYMENSTYHEPLTMAVREIISSFEQGCVAEDMKNFLHRFMSGKLGNAPEKYQEMLKKHIPLADGNCGRRILEDIKTEIITECAINEKKLRMVLFGAGFICAHYLEQLRLKEAPSIDIVAMSDNAAQKWNSDFEGIKVISPEKLAEIDFDILLIMSESYFMPIKKKLVYELFLPEEKIWRLDEFCEAYLYREMGGVH